MATLQQALDGASDWTATHRIVFRDQSGAEHIDEVMLTDEGPAYTRDEWEATDSAAWVLDAGGWTCQGQATPQGANGTVEVEEVI